MLLIRLDLPVGMDQIPVLLYFEHSAENFVTEHSFTFE